MNLFQRLNNLWEMSSWEIPEIGADKNAAIGTKFAMLMKKPEKVKILKKETNLEDLIKKNDE